MARCGAGIEGSEAGAIARVNAASGLQAKVEAFEKAFLRAGVKHYDSRLQWARIAVDAFREADNAPTGPVILPSTPNPPPPDIPSSDPAQPAKKKGGWGWLIITGIAIAAALLFVALVPLPI
jgi:hypothetical protein